MLLLMVSLTCMRDASEGVMNVHILNVVMIASLSRCRNDMAVSDI